MPGSSAKSVEDLSHDLLKTLEPGLSSPPLLPCPSPLPPPRRWSSRRMTILQIMSIFAVMVNSGIIAFTGTYTEDYRWASRVWIFITFTAGVLV
jgi:hypothetical protein